MALFLLFSPILSANWSDFTLPPPTTATASPSYPPTHPPTQSWPTNPAIWPPTMSPYPTMQPHDVITPTESGKSPLSIGAIVGIVVSCVVAAAIIIAIVVYVVLKRRNNSKSVKGSFSLLTSLNDQNSKNE